MIRNNRCSVFAEAVVILAFCAIASGVTGTGSGFEAPDTATGKCVAAWFSAFNSGDDREMLAFEDRYRARSYTETLGPDERLANYERLRDIFGQLTPRRVVRSLERQITLIAESAKIDGVLVVRFQLEDAPPHGLDYLRFTGINRKEIPDAYALRAADRAQPVDAGNLEETVRSAARILEEKYVIPDVGKAMADRILGNLEDGDYDRAGKAGRLADMLTEDVVDVSGDSHVWIEAANPLDPGSAYPENRPVEELRRENYHFRRAELLPGNVGYVKFDMIHDDPEAQDIAATALAFVAWSDALILDLRDNIGGEWGSGRLILSYLLPPNTPLSRLFDRDGRMVGADSTVADLGGKRFPADMPVYVLTSGKTGSAAEAFAFAIQQSGRGTVVGETTVGGGYRCDEFRINPLFIMSVSTSRAVSAFDNKSFQGVGVVPDIEVPGGDALEKALEAVRLQNEAASR